MVQMVKQVVLDPEQEAAVEQMCSLKKDVQTLGGLAGTGKTTTIRAIYRRLPNWAVCAYTGKAAQMLRRKGIPSASTIHSLIYRPIFDDNGNVTGFDLKSPEEFEYDGIIVDEASMVGDDVYRDLVSLGVPLIFVGDHGQLEPVRASGFNLMASPDVTLETIHRNAGEIARFAAYLRTGGRAVDWQSEGAVEVLNVGALAERGIDSEIDQIICAYNRTRVELNNLAREHLGLPEGRPAVGDRIMCLQNDRKLHIFNGMQGKLTWISGNRLRFQADGVSVVVRYMPAAFGAEKAPGYVRGVMPFDWCYCVTCHKCVHPDTLVETGQGLLPIWAIQETGVVATPTGAKAYANLVSNPPADALRILCEGGYEVTVTPDHKVEVWNGQEFTMVEAKDTTVGAFMRLRLGTTIDQTCKMRFVDNHDLKLDVRAVRQKLPEVMTEELAEFLGLMVADGTIWNSGFRLAKRHHDVVERFSYLVEHLFGYETRKFDTHGTPTAEVNSTHIVRWLERVGGMMPNAKDVPLCVLGASVQIHKAFLRGLFEDGGVAQSDGYIEWCSVFPSLRTTVRTMLLRIGIAVGECLTRPSAMYIYANNARKFMDEIGFVSSRKNTLGRSIEYTDEVRYSRVPMSKDMLKEIKASIGPGNYTNGVTRGYITRQVLASSNVFADMLDWHYVRIRSIETTECPSMCVEVPDGHRFLQNGFPHGNSQGDEWERVMVVEQRCGAWQHERWAYTAASRAKVKLTWVLEN